MRLAIRRFNGALLRSEVDDVALDATIALEALFSEMPDVRLEDATIFIATGTHRRNDQNEIERMIGREVASRCRIVCHDAREFRFVIGGQNQALAHIEESTGQSERR